MGRSIWPWGTLVQGHDDIRTQVPLDLHAALGAQELGGAVEVALELDPLLGNLAQGGQGEDLKAPGIGEDRAVPAHEGVKPPHAGDEPVPGTETEVIGVAQDHLGADLGELGRSNPLDGALGPHGHEGGSEHPAVGRIEMPCPGSAVLSHRIQ